MQHVGWDVQHLAFAHDHFLLPVRTNVEVQRAGQDVCELLVVVRVLRHERVLLQVHVREHHLIAGDELASDGVGDALLRNLGPAEMTDFSVGHIDLVGESWNVNDQPRTLKYLVRCDLRAALATRAPLPPRAAEPPRAR